MNGAAMKAVRLGVLDQSPIPSGASAADALNNSIDLAQACERFGYYRYWVAEHHNSEGLAGAAPEILLSHIAAATETMMVGSGGIMLSHYSPFKVAETFKVLNALHPGRIELGVGRAPGSDPLTMYALAAADEVKPVEQYPAMVRELLGFLDRDLPADSPFVGRVRAVPSATETAPPVWLLASSADSASFAAHFGLPLAWAHFFTQSNDGPAIVDAYRQQYQPSERFPEPVVAFAASVICADSDAEAAELAEGVDLWRQRGLAGPIPSPEEAAATLSAARPRLAVGSRQPTIVGTADRALADIAKLAEAYQCEDVFVVTITWSHQARVRSYELLAAEAGLKP